MTRFILSVITAALMLSSCRHAGDNKALNPGAGTPAAGRLTIEKEKHYFKVTVSEPWQNSSGIKHVWYLVPRDSAMPAGISEAQTIRIPVRRMICMSATHIAMMRALGAESLIAGISGSSLIYDSVVREGLHNGTIRDVGYEGNLNMELVVSLAPDLLMAYGVADPSTGNTSRLSETGVKVFYNADYLEEHPLSRCEWIRLFGLLTGREKMADSIFAGVSGAYRDLAEKVSDAVTDRPDVLLGAPWEDVWYVSPAGSYIGRLIEDAGGHYIYSDMTGLNSVPYSVESVFRKAMEADLWINPGAADNLAEIAAADPRLASLPLFREGNVWNNRLRVTEAGGNDYWESAVVRPDLLLSDIVSIIHPGLMPGYVQFYYRKLE